MRATRARGVRLQNAVDVTAAIPAAAASDNDTSDIRSVTTSKNPNDRSHGGSNPRADGAGLDTSPFPNRVAATASRSRPRLASSQLATPRGALDAKSDATSCETSAARSISSAAARVLSVIASSRAEPVIEVDQGNTPSSSSESESESESVYKCSLSAAPMMPALSAASAARTACTNSGLSLSA